MRKVKPLRLYPVVKWSVLVFGLVGLAALLLPLQLIRGMALTILMVNGIASCALGLHIYNRYERPELEYDDVGFLVRKGKSEARTGRWADLRQISVVKSPLGQFSVRVYGLEGFTDLPADALGMNPFEFRDELMNLVEERKSKDGYDSMR